MYLCVDGTFQHTQGDVMIAFKAYLKSVEKDLQSGRATEHRDKGVVGPLRPCAVRFCDTSNAFQAQRRREEHSLPVLAGELHRASRRA